jgi:cell division protein FtsW
MTTAATIQYSRSAGRQPRLVLDSMIVALTLAIVLLGLVMVTSASVTIADRQTGDPFFYLERQAVSALLGGVLATALLFVPVATWERLSPALMIGAFALLVVVLIPGLGHEVNGSRRWIRLGAFNFQPSEAARVMLLIYVSGYAVRRSAELRTTLGGFLKPLGVLALAACLLLVEPDFGAAVVLLATGGTVLFLAGARWRYVLAVLGVGVVLVGLIAVSSAYRVRRLTAFLDPWADPFKTGFQLTQSLIAIGRGEWFGVGLGSSVQKLFYLPEAHTDFVFAVMAEELGLAGVVLTIGLFTLLVLRAFRVARLAADAGKTFHACMAAAFAIWLGLQASVNIGVNMGLLPTKGLTLPLLSYGRSSLLITLAWVGLLLRINHEVAAHNRAAVPRAERDS